MDYRFLSALLLGITIELAGVQVQAQTLAVTIPDDDDPILAELPITDDAADVGMWSPSASWPLVSIHATLLPDGTVLTYGSPVGQGVQDGRTFVRWNPITGEVTTTPNSQNVNSFCSAAILQPDTGALLVTGGNEPLQSSMYDFTTSTASTLSATLAADRWYGSMTMLADGRTLMTGGAFPYAINVWQNPDADQSLNDVSMTPEVYTPGTGWSSLFGANSRDAFGPDHNRWWYPRQWVAPDGLVFGISSEKWWRMDPSGVGSFVASGDFKTGVDNTNRPNIGPTSTAVMYDVGRVLQVGGNGYVNGQDTPSSERATIFDIRNGDPVITDVSSMQVGRQWPNATVLPSGQVVITGGTQRADNGGSDAVYQAELWDPATLNFSPLASASVIRNYHSTTILLPSGAIFSSGGGVPGPVTNFNYEIFYPPYLFQAASGPDELASRPRFLSIDANRFDFGESFQVELSDTRNIAQVALIGLSTTTHSFNMGQRYVPTTFSQQGTMLTVDTPVSPNLAPPGFYLLFAVDDSGIPSRGFVVALGAGGCQSDTECNDNNTCTVDSCSSGFCTHDNTCTDPLATYPFDSAGEDATGNGNDATLANGASIVAGPTSNVADLDSGDQHVALPPSLLTSCDDFTFAAWVALDSNADWSRIFDFGNGTATNMFLTPKVGGQDALRFAIKVPGINGDGEAQLTFPMEFPLDTWTHVAVVLEGDNGRLYVDGTEVATGTVVANPSELGATVNNWLGQSQYAADPNLDGRLDDVLLSCRAYSAVEVGALANAAECTSGSDCADGDACTADVCAAGLCDNPDNGTCAAACGDGTCAATEDCSSCATDCGACPVADPLAIYGMDEGTGSIVGDSSGNSLDGALLGGATFTADGQLLGAVDIQGNAPHVALPAGLVEPCSDFSFAAFVRLDSNGDWSRIFDFGSDTGTNMFLTPKVGGADILRFALKVPGNNGGAEEQISFPVALPLDTWFHVAVVLAGDQGFLYLDGTEVATAPVLGNPVDMGATTNNWLGRSQYAADPYLDGTLDEVRISCRAYSAAEVNALAAAASALCQNDEACDDGDPCTADLCGTEGCAHPDNGSCTPAGPLAIYPLDDGSGTVAADLSGNQQDAVLTGGASFTSAGHIGGALEIDGTGQYLALPEDLVSGCSDFSFASFVQLDSNAGWNRIFDFGSDTTTNMFLTPKVGGADIVRFAIKSPGVNGGNEEQLSFAYAFPLGTWTHVAVVLNGDVGTLYIDGTAVATAVITGDPSDLGATPNTWLGRSQYPDPYFDGRLDDVRLSCRAWSPAEVQTHFNANAQALDRRSLISTTQVVTAQFDLQTTLNALAANGGLPENGSLLYQQLIDSYASAPGSVSTAVHCGDESSSSTPTLNGYPIQCDRLEAQQLSNLSNWFATGVVNRIDLAPANGAHCGSQRLIFANNTQLGNGRMLMILEAQLPNPNPSAGLAGCRPIAEFWDSLEGVADPVQRGALLVDAFLGTGITGIGPFMSAPYLMQDTGQIRTNNFNDTKWTLREFKLAEQDGQLRVDPAPVGNSPHGALWNDLSTLPAGDSCRQDFLEALSGLLTDNPAAMAFPVAQDCKNSESFNDFTAENYPLHLLQGDPDGFTAELEARLAGTGLTPVDLAARARFAGSCIGCHQESRGSSLGNGVQAPVSLGFVHISDSVVETCTDGACFAISPGLRDAFLPYRKQFMDALLSN